MTGPMTIDEMVAALSKLVTVRAAARAVGLTVTNPPALQAACEQVIRLAQDPHVQYARPEPDPMYELIPIRQLLWYVIEPGQQVTVPDVVERLGELGRHENASVVSNALGYWVPRGELVRVKKGLYLRPASDMG